MDSRSARDVTKTSSPSVSAVNGEQGTNGLESDGVSSGRAAQQNEEFFRSLSACCPVGIFMTDTNGLCAYTNPQCQKICGFTSEEALGEGWARFVHAEDREQVVGSWKSAIRLGQSYSREFRFQAPDGSIRWVHARSSPLRDRSAGIMGHVGTVEDITDRTIATDRLNLVLSSIDDHLVCYDRQWRYVYVNDKAAQILGKTKEELLGKSIWDLFPDAVGNQYYRELHKVAEEGCVIRSEHFYAPFDKWFENHIYPSREGITVFSADVTWRKKAEDMMHRMNKELEEKVAERTHALELMRQRDRLSIQRLKAIIARLPMAAVALDEQDTVIEANELVCKLWGLSVHSSTLIGRRIEDIAALWQHCITRVEEVQEGSLELYEGATVHELHLQDQRIILRETIKAVEAGTSHGSLLLFRDVTRERRVDTAKTEFMSLASHQLRTPLTSIRWAFGKLEKVLQGRLEEPEMQLLTGGKRASIYMAETIDTMLQISRIQAGHVKIMSQDVQLSLLLWEVTESFRKEIDEKRQIVTVTCDERISLSTDSQLLREVLSNLVSNAIKYTPDEGKTHLHAQARDGSVQIAVRDNGYGIPLHQQSKVFQKFFRGDNVVPHETEGTGLGLYLASLIAGLLAGTLQFISEEGKGTTFTLTLPVAADAGSRSS